MIRSSLFAALGVLSIIGMGALPLACQSGGVGDPCIPEDEYNPQFAGYKVTEENIESRSFQCQTRICLVNHFQGRVSCPFGQPPVGRADGRKREACGPQAPCTNAGEKCVEAATLAPDCTKNEDCTAYGSICNKEGKFCECGAATVPPEGFFCDAKSKQLKSYVCHKPGSCQTGDSKDEADKAKDCCIPGTDTPVVDSVCGQCDSKSNRNADDAVYCSCRCGVADGQPDDPNFNFCTCPTGFECKEIRKNVGISDPQITGKYCIKQNTAYDSAKATQCQVGGYFSSEQCEGLKAQ